MCASVPGSAAFPPRTRTSESVSRCAVFVITITLAFAVLSSRKAFGVNPPPDGGYPGANTAEGDDALFSLTTGKNNTAIGDDALRNNTGGSFNTATGADALHKNTSGINNTANGFQALARNTIGGNNTAVGIDALSNNTFGSGNTAVGDFTLAKNIVGFGNVAVGSFALFENIGDINTAIGSNALLSNTTGDGNTAVGIDALASNTMGRENTASGDNALGTNTSGNFNTADGSFALSINDTGHNNVAIGCFALGRNRTGSSNIALGTNAGSNLTGNDNIDIGNMGRPGEGNTIRIGAKGKHTATFIAGISGAAVSGTAVVVNTNGKLGVATSSARFKEAIKPMEKASEAILGLKPVMFRYKEEIDPDKISQFGLIAEDVAKVDTDLVGRDVNGKVTTVRYEAVNAMLLNEFLKEHRKVEQLEADLVRQRQEYQATTARQQQEIDALRADIGR